MVIQDNKTATSNYTVANAAPVVRMGAKPLMCQIERRPLPSPCTLVQNPSLRLNAIQLLPPTSTVSGERNFKKESRLCRKLRLAKSSKRKGVSPA